MAFKLLNFNKLSVVDFPHPTDTLYSMIHTGKIFNIYSSSSSPFSASLSSTSDAETGLSSPLSPFCVTFLFALSSFSFAFVTFLLFFFFFFIISELLSVDFYTAQNACKSFSSSLSDFYKLYVLPSCTFLFGLQ